MRIAILPTPEDIAVVAADRIQQLLARKPAAVLGLATGSTPLPLYDELTKRCEAGQISFAQTQSFNLDEYVGLPEDHPEGYANFIHRFLVDRVDFPREPRTAPTSGPVTTMRPPQTTTRQSATLAVLTSRSSESAQTDTSASTNPVAPSPRAPTSMCSPSRPAATMRASLTETSPKFRPTASPRA